MIYYLNDLPLRNRSCEIDRHSRVVYCVREVYLHGRIEAELYCASMIPGSIIAPSIIWRLSDLMLAALMAVNCAVMIRGRRYIT